VPSHSGRDQVALPNRGHPVADLRWALLWTYATFSGWGSRAQLLIERMPRPWPSLLPYRKAYSKLSSRL
jgi:hypothetical protein